MLRYQLSQLLRIIHEDDINLVDKLMSMWAKRDSDRGFYAQELNRLRFGNMPKGLNDSESCVIRDTNGYSLLITTNRPN